MDIRFFVYILASHRNGTLYVGVTNDLARRMFEHKGKSSQALPADAASTSSFYFEEFSSINEARAREYALKRWKRAWKLELIEKLNPEWRDLSTELAF